MKKLLVIDGNSILNRAFYGVRPLTNRKGMPTNALFGMLNILLKQLSEVSPDYTAIAFDLPAPTFRHEKYPEYKAGRHKMPDELAIQLPYSKELARALGFKVLELEGYEADDILGTVSRMAKYKTVDSYVLTGDRDSLQLIDEWTYVLLATNNDTVKFDRERFFEKYGVQPESFIDVKALMGDSSDNIPGVPGIGEKTALKLIAEYENIDSVYENIETAPLGKSARQKMIDGKESAYLSKWLVTIDRKAPIDVTIDDLENKGFDKEKLSELLMEFEFTSFLNRLGLGASANKKSEVSDDSSEKEPTVRHDVKKIGINELNTLSGKKYGFELLENKAYFASGNELYEVEFDDVSLLAGALENAKPRLAVCDVKRLCHEISTELFEMLSEDDVMLAAYVLEPSRSSYGLTELSNVYLGGASVADGADRARAIYALSGVLNEKLAEANQTELYKKVELPLAFVLADMEKTGFKLDTKALSEFLSVLIETERDYAQRIYMLAGREFNINSPKQLGEVLFDELKLPAGKKTKTGYSTSAEILEKLKGDYPIVADILDYRGVTKLRSTYAEGLLRAADENGAVHTSFNQTTTVTGRLSSTEPNLQNIPVRTELGREMRRFFVAKDENYCLIDADYSQIELRLIAHISKDENMINAFHSGEDIHTVTASQVFGVPLGMVTSSMRKRAKAVNFGIVYGIGEFSLAADIGVTRKEAGEYIKSYFAQYPGIKAYLDGVVEAAKELGYVETIFGRRRYIPELNAQKAVLRAFGERVAMNSPIQGSSADVIKIAMINVRRALKAEGLDARLILQVHDELIVEAHKDCAERASKILKNEMENVTELSVPITVELQTADNWYECKD